MSEQEITVLVVDDEGIILRLVNRFLRNSGFVPILASDPVIARRICEETERRVDIVLSDVTLLAGGAAGFWSCIRNRFPQARVVYMSGYPEDHMEELGHARPALFLQKPFTEDGLITILNRAMRSEKVANGNSLR